MVWFIPLHMMHHVQGGTIIRIILLMIKRLLKGALNLFANVSQQLLTFIVGIYAARILTLEQYGAFSLIKYILTYSSFITLGITEAVYFKLPGHLARKNTAKIKIDQHMLFTISFLSIIFFGLFSVFSFLRVPLNDVDLSREWLLLGGIVFVASLSSFALILYQCYQKFLELPIIKLIYPIVFGSLIFILLPRLQLTGYLIAMLLGYVCMVLFSLKFVGNKMGFVWDFKKAGSYIKFGLPIKMSTLIASIFISIDLWVISFFIGSEQAGLYGFMRLVGVSFGVIPRVLSQFLKPRVIWFYSKINTNVKELNKIFKQLFVMNICNGISICVMVLVFFHFLIMIYLPKYSDILIIAPILLAGYLIKTINQSTAIFLILLKKQMKKLYINILVLVLAALMDLAAAIFFKSLILIAVATTIALLFSSVLGLILLARSFTILNVKRFVMKISLFIIIGIAIISYTYYILHTVGVNWLDIRLYTLLIPMVLPGLIGFKKFYWFWNYSGKSVAVNNNTMDSIDPEI